LNLWKNKLFKIKAVLPEIKTVKQTEFLLPGKSSLDCIDCVNAKALITPTQSIYSKQNFYLQNRLEFD